MEFKAIADFFNRDNGTATERIAKLIFNDFSGFLMKHAFIGEKDTADALALKVALDLFLDRRFLSDPQRATSIAAEELFKQAHYFSQNFDKRGEVLRSLKNFLPKVNQYRFLKN